MNHEFRKAVAEDKSSIWSILQQAILRRKNDGSQQWQDGYPSEEVVQRDIERGIGYVLTIDNEVAAYAAVILNDEPAYDGIVGKWLTNGDFYVIHRIAVSDKFSGKGLGKKIMEMTEAMAIKNGVPSVKVDTNFDNPAMLKTFENCGYTYCGEVFFRGSARRAYEKVVIK